MKTRSRTGMLFENRKGQTIVDAILEAMDTYLNTSGFRPTTVHVPPSTMPKGCMLWQTFHQGRPVSVIANTDIEEGHFSTALCHLGNITARTGRNLSYDGKTESIPGDPEAQALTRRKYRQHWGTPKGV